MGRTRTPRDSAERAGRLLAARRCPSTFPGSESPDALRLRPSRRLTCFPRAPTSAGKSLFLFLLSWVTWKACKARHRKIYKTLRCWVYFCN